MSRNDQQPTCTNVACGNQTLITIKHCLVERSQCSDTRKKYNMQSIIRTVLERECEVEKIMWYLKDIRVFEEI